MATENDTGVTVAFVNSLRTLPSLRRDARLILIWRITCSVPKRGDFDIRRTSERP
jgi:hypothetical protein